MKKILSIKKKAVPLHAFSLNGYCELALLRVNNPPNPAEEPA